MTQEEKEKLYIALCGYLPYGVICKHKNHNIVLKPAYLDFNNMKPYLRPMESMTEEEHQELTKLVNNDNLLTGNPAKTICSHCGVVIDFHNSHFLDWRGLIPMGLALPAKEGMYND